MFRRPLARPATLRVAYSVIERFGVRWRLLDLINENGPPGSVLRPGAAGGASQNADGTNPAGPGDPVGRVHDRSGQGHHATQDDTDKQPTLHEDGYIAFTEGDELVIVFENVDTVTVGYAWPGGPVIESEVALDEGQLIIDSDFYSIVVIEGTLNQRNQRELEKWLDAQVTTYAFTVPAAFAGQWFRT